MYEDALAQLRHEMDDEHKAKVERRRYKRPDYQVSHFIGAIVYKI